LKACLVDLEGSDIQVARGIRRLRDAVALVLVAGGAAGAWANRLDKTACADLSAEVSSLLAAGLKGDMDKGPAWGAANLSLERLVAINRVIDLQGQIEFRCGSGKVADKATTNQTSTAKSSGEAADETPSLPSQKAKPVRGKRGSAAKSLELSPVAPATAAPVAASHAAASPAPPASPTPNSPQPAQGERAAATSPSAASPPQPATVAPTTTAPKAAADTSKPATTPATTPPLAPTNAAATPAVQKSAARKKSSRRDGSAYVSPKEANPFSLLLGN